MKNKKYTIITPAYNEAQLLPLVIQSIVEQTELPEEWIIVDDRSTDNTWDVITEAAKKYSFIRPVFLSGDKTRRLGANVVYVFDEGYKQLSNPSFDFIVKMDADSVLPKQYFEQLLDQFEDDPQLGMASGKTFILEKDVWLMERCPDMHVMGACKMYRHSCFKDIGGFIPILGWDKLDCAKARMEGWKTRSFGELPIYHLRQMGSEMGMSKTYASYGKSSYYLREHPLFVVGRAIYRAIERPYCSSFFMIWGYIIAQIKREKRLEDLELANFFR
ncbi:MAG: glycosyltransferase family 2 protein, partial [Candidatus Electrothrix sp. AUS3]|nr:glycosyltransferase family 2 protein [Candidatus Electrothrix gigas]